MNRITLNSNDLLNIIKESVNIILNEGQTLKVDNFDKFAKILRLDDSDLFYFVEVIQRKKDNPTVSFHKNGTDMSSNTRYIKTYSIGSAEELLSLKDEIISLCEQNNARAYMSINPRSKKMVDNYVQHCKSKGMFRGREWEHAAGQHKERNDKMNNWEELRPYGLIDMDIPDEAAQKKLEKILDRFNLKPVETYITPNGGKHYIMPDRYCKYLDFSEFESYRPNNDGSQPRRRNSDPMVLFKGDSPVILYSNISW
jgi:hypothetical protein